MIASFTLNNRHERLTSALRSAFSRLFYRFNALSQAQWRQ